MKAIALLIVSLLILSTAPRSTAEDKPAAATTKTTKTEEIDWDKARDLYQRQQRGEKLTADEQAYLDHAKEVRHRNQPAGPNNPGPAPTPKDSTGLIPLTQLKADQSYQGFDGGLYGHGRNDPPERLLHAALEMAGKVQPLDGEGNPARDGKVVLMSMGMSNTTMEFSRFKQLADRDPGKSPKLLIVDAAQGSMDAKRWDVSADQPPWTVADERLKAAGATPRQVQVIWIKQALAGPRNYGEFPKHADALKQYVESAIKRAKDRYPNLKLVYLSSRIYAGYATTPLNPEPYAYEGAFAMRGVIDDQMKGDLSAPIVLWGPYLWADGVKGREGDALTYEREDLGGDGTHPSESGRQKVAELLLGFFKADKTAKGWFGT